MEHDHPHALDFLRKDCQNVNDFFQKKVRNASVKPVDSGKRRRVGLRES